MTSTSRRWFCSEEIRATDRTEVVADLNVVVHVGCLDRLYEPRDTRRGRRSAGSAHNEPNDDGQEGKAS